MARSAKASYDQDVKALNQLFAQFDKEARAWLDYLAKIEDLEAA